MDRAELGIRYITKYLGDQVLNAEKSRRSLLKPMDILCEVTYLCNLECPTCFRWTSKPGEKELTAEEWKELLAKLKSWIGSFNFVISGGEPLMKQDILDVISFATDKGIVSTLISNGSLIDKDMARKLVDSGLDALSLSLNSLIPEIHNKTRGTNNSFNEVMSAIENLRDRDGMALTLSTTVLDENLSELPDMLRFVKDKGLDGINFQPLMSAEAFPVYDSDGGAESFSEGRFYKKLAGVRAEEVDEVFSELTNLKQDGAPINNSMKHLRIIAEYLKDTECADVKNFICPIGPKNFFIDPFGNVRICSIMDSIGNVREDDPATIWNSPKAMAQREAIIGCDKACRVMNCNFKHIDIGSRFGRFYKMLRGKSR